MFEKGMKMDKNEVEFTLMPKKNSACVNLCYLFLRPSFFASILKRKKFQRGRLILKPKRGTKSSHL